LGSLRSNGVVSPATEGCASQVKHLIVSRYKYPVHLISTTKALRRALVNAKAADNTTNHKSYSVSSINAKIARIK
jgi:hypothetical protein